jgi:hypothetical protein
MIAGKMVIDHGAYPDGRYEIPTSNLVAGKVNSLLYVRNGTTAEVWINGVTQGSKTVGNSLPTDDTALPFSIGEMVGDSNYKSALKFNAPPPKFEPWSTTSQPALFLIK